MWQRIASADTHGFAQFKLSSPSGIQPQTPVTYECINVLVCAPYGRSVALPGKLMAWGAGRKERSVRATTGKANTSLLASTQGRFRIKNCGVGNRPKGGQRRASGPHQISGTPSSAPRRIMNGKREGKKL